MSIVSLESSGSFSVPGVQHPRVTAWRDTVAAEAPPTPPILPGTPLPAYGEAARTPPPAYRSAGARGGAVEQESNHSSQANSVVSIPSGLFSIGRSHPSTVRADDPIVPSRTPTTIGVATRRGSAVGRQRPPSTVIRPASSRRMTANRGPEDTVIAPNDSVSAIGRSQTMSDTSRSSRTSLTESSVDRVAHRVHELSLGGTSQSRRIPLPATQEEASTSAVHPRGHHHYKRLSRSESVREAIGMAVGKYEVRKDSRGRLQLVNRG